jgi:hypothetical protein
MRQLIELEKVHPDIGMCHQRSQHISDESPSRPHLLDLGQRSILDHPEILPYAFQHSRPVISTMQTSRLMREVGAFLENLCQQMPGRASA